MPEIRVDPLSGYRSIIAGDRSARPGAGLQFAGPAWFADPATDPFAEGNESRTPPELYAVGDPQRAANTPGWHVRVVPNLYPALAPEVETPARDASPDLFYAQAASGAHEVIINSPQQVTSLAELPLEQLKLAVEVWQVRMRTHADAAYVHVLVNERPEAGASLPHTHAQLYALDFVPAAIARERERFGAYAVANMGSNLLGDLVQEEVRRQDRIVAIDDEAVLYAPYASRLPYQLQLAPRKPHKRFEEAGPVGAALLHDALRRLVELFGKTPPLNLWVRTAPAGADHFCWRIDVLPRLTNLAGLELGTGLNVNILSPEQAVHELRQLW